MAHLYYTDAVTGVAVGDAVTVTGDEARHAVAVARLQNGENILLGDGSGYMVRAVVRETVKNAGNTTFTAAVTEVVSTAADAAAPRVTLVQALAKGDRGERAVELATEFGVTQIVPWQAGRCIVKWDNAAKAHRGTQKWQRIAREASKQSLRHTVPNVVEPSTTPQLVQLFKDSTAAVFLLHPWAETKLTAHLRNLLTEDALPQQITLIVGPEGGVSDAELEQFSAAGVTPVKIGDTVLRTSSAAAAALAVINAGCGSW